MLGEGLTYVSAATSSACGFGPGPALDRLRDERVRWVTRSYDYYAMRFFALAAVVLSMALVSTATFAADRQSLKLEHIREQQSRLRVEVRAAKGAFKDMTPADRDALLGKQERVLTLLQGKHDAENLSEIERLEVVNLLEEIKAAIAKAENERKVCKRTKMVGSNLPQVVCMTAAQQREQQERARNMMLRGQRCADTSCLSSGG